MNTLTATYFVLRLGTDGTLSYTSGGSFVSRLGAESFAEDANVHAYRNGLPFAYQALDARTVNKLIATGWTIREA